MMRPPLEFSADLDCIDAYCLPIASRRGGLLLAVPHSAINDDALEAGQVAEGRAFLGPSNSKTIVTGLEVEDETGMVAVSEEACP